MLIKKSLGKLTVEETVRLVVSLSMEDKENCIVWHLYDLMAPHLEKIVAGKLKEIARDSDNAETILEEIEALEWLYDLCNDQYQKMNDNNGKF